MSPHEDFIRASKLDTKQVEQVLDTYEKAVKTLSAGDAGWHGPNDIRKITGLEGRFLWTEDLLALAIISFKFDPNSVDPNGGAGLGTYTLARAGITVEQGDFQALANNPIIGIAGITLVPQGGSDPHLFFIQGMLTDANWSIITMALEKMGPQGPLPPLFWAVRMP